MPLKLINPIQNQALKYAAGGLPVLPLFEPNHGGCACGDPECRRPGKHPRTRNGVRDATTDPQEITDMWDRWPLANLGIATGGAARLLVLDLDGPEGIASLKALESMHGPLPATFTGSLVDVDGTSISGQELRALATAASARVSTFAGMEDT